MTGTAERTAERAAGHVAWAREGTAAAGMRPLPLWFFAFEALMSAAYDLCHVWVHAWMVLVALAGVNMLAGLTVLGRRRKLVRAMLRSSRTRMVAVGLIALRVGVHLLLGAVGTQITTAAGHLALAVGMAATTFALLWFDQRVVFRTLGLTGPAAGGTVRTV